MVSKASELFPEPLRPVITVSLLRGISTSMFFRLCWRAPCTVMRSSMRRDCPHFPTFLHPIRCRHNLKSMLKVGDKAPDFEVRDDRGKTFHLSGLKGKTVILYFYPKADTPGCTKAVSY